MRDLARLAITAFGRQGERSGVIGVDVQRIRRGLGLQARGQGADGEAEPLDPDEHPRVRAPTCAASSSAATIERTGKLPPSRPLAELDRALPTSPSQDLAAVHRAVSQLKRRIATLGHEQRGRRSSQVVDVRRTMRASLETGGVPLRLRYPPEAPAPPRDLRPLRRLDFRQQRQRLLPLGPARASRLVPEAAQLRLHRADQRGDRHLRARAGLPQDLRAQSPRRAGSLTSRATPTTAGSGSSSARRSPRSSALARR